jgi:hypothetical protein
LPHLHQPATQPSPNVHSGTLSSGPWSITPRLFTTTKKESRMDDYWEELLEYRAAETDPLEPADDATEL